MGDSARDGVRRDGQRIAGLERRDERPQDLLIITSGLCHDSTGLCCRWWTENKRSSREAR